MHNKLRKLKISQLISFLKKPTIMIMIIIIKIKADINKLEKLRQ